VISSWVAEVHTLQPSGHALAPAVLAVALSPAAPAVVLLLVPLVAVVLLVLVLVLLFGELLPASF
jgi:hypothetical protein